MTAIGELFIATGGADGKAISPSAFVAAASVGELAVPVLAADGKTVLMTVIPSAAGELGFPVLTADGKIVQVQGVNRIIYFNGAYLDVGETFSSTKYSLDADSVWLPDFDVPLVFPQEAPYLFTNIAIYLGGQNTVELSNSIFGAQLKYEDDSLSARFIFPLITDSQISTQQSGLPPENKSSSTHWNNVIAAYLATRTEIDKAKKVKSYRLNVTATCNISGSGPYGTTGYLYFRASIAYMLKAL